MIQMTAEETCAELLRWAVVMLPLDINSEQAADWLREHYGDASRLPLGYDGNGVYIIGRRMDALKEWDFAISNAGRPTGVFFIKDPKIAVEFKLRFG